MTKANSAAPSEDAVLAAREVLQRHHEAMLQAALAFAKSDELAVLVEKLGQLPVDLASDPVLGHHISAIQQGAFGLTSFAQQVEATAAAATAAAAAAAPLNPAA